MVALAVLVLAACGREERPLRIGVVVDCVGALRSDHDAELAGAQLPLLVRGAHRRGVDPSAGLEGGRAAGRRVELVEGCGETGEFSTVTLAARRLVENEHVDAVVEGGRLTVDGLWLREVARRHPDVAFVAAPNGPREVTASSTRPGVFRVAADFGQGVAGLATYAYRRLGWRRVALVVENWVAGWGAETVFVREFCALGGRVASRTALLLDPSANNPRRVPRGADGVAVLASPLTLSPEYLAALARRTGVPARRLVLGPELAADQDVLLGSHAPLDGVVGATYAPPASSSAAVRAYVRQYGRAFPGSAPTEPLQPTTVTYRNAVEAVLRAFQSAGGERSRLRAALARLRTRLLGVPVRMEAGGQAAVAATLVRLHGADGRELAMIPGVDASVGGLVPRRYVPSSSGQACRRAPPPPWAR